MKATIEFVLPEENQAYLRAALCAEAYEAIASVDHQMRNIIKHGHNYKSVEELAQHIRDELSHVRPTD